MNDQNHGPVFGGTSLMVILCVICLSVFCVLCLSTSLSELRLSEASAAAVAAYYEADTKAEEIYTMLRSGANPQNVQEHGAIYQYLVPISPSQALHVTLEKQDSNWIVLQWQAVSSPTAQSAPDPSLWDGASIQEDNP